MKKIAKYIPPIVLLIASITTATFGAVLITQNVPSTITIQSSPHLTIVSSTGGNFCSNTVLTSLSFPQIGAAPGSKSVAQVCIENPGNAPQLWIDHPSGPVTVNSITTDFNGLAGLSMDWGLQIAGASSCTNQPSYNLGIGSALPINITITNDGTAPGITDWGFTTVFTGFTSCSG